MGGRRRPQDVDRFPDRSVDGADAYRRHVRVAVRAHLHDRLYGRRRRLFALLLVHLSVHVLDAHAGHGQQLPPAFLRLGGGGPGFVPADRFLVQAGDGDLREPEGVHRQSGRRLRLHSRHRPDPRVFRLDGLCRRCSRKRRNWPAPRSTCGAMRSGCCSPWSASASSSARWARARRCLFTCGCRIRWKAPPRSPR